VKVLKDDPAPLSWLVGWLVGWLVSQSDSQAVSELVSQSVSQFYDRHFSCNSDKYGRSVMLTKEWK
jgi:hypothetical protein